MTPKPPSTLSIIARSILAAAATLVLLLGAGCAVAARQPSAAAPTTLPTRQATAGQQVVLSNADRRLQATLDDTPAGRAFTARLPLTLSLRDTMGQARTATLVQPLDVTGVPTITRPTTGGVYYEPETGQVAIFYNSLGQQVPAPGLVKLGTLINPAAPVPLGDWTTVRITPA